MFSSKLLSLMYSCTGLNLFISFLQTIQHEDGPTKINYRGVVKDVRQNRARDRKKNNRLDAAPMVDLSDSSDTSNFYEEFYSANIGTVQRTTATQPKNTSNHGSVRESYTGQSTSVSSFPEENGMLLRVRKRAANNLRDRAISPTSKKLSRKVFKGLVSPKDKEIVAAIDDVDDGKMGSQEVLKEIEPIIGDSP